jgi:uncharacterized membrane protein
MVKKHRSGSTLSKPTPSGRGVEGLTFLIAVDKYPSTAGNFLFTLILWLLLMVKALRGERYLLPIVGKMVEDKTGQ